MIMKMSIPGLVFVLLLQACDSETRFSDPELYSKSEKELLDLEISLHEVAEIKLNDFLFLISGFTADNNKGTSLGLLVRQKRPGRELKVSFDDGVYTVRDVLEGVAEQIGAELKIQNGLAIFELKIE